jgi:hypothetical protein
VKLQTPRPSATLPRQAGAGGMTKLGMTKGGIAREGRVAGTQFWRMSVESLSASVDRSTRTSMFSSLQRRKPVNFRYLVVGNCGRSIAMKMGIELTESVGAKANGYSSDFGTQRILQRASKPAARGLPLAKPLPSELCITCQKGEANECS